MWIVSGRKDNFDVSPAIQPGTCQSITIRQNKEGRFMFGPFSLDDLSHGKNHVHVNLFDAQQASNAVKIIIWRSDSVSKFEASMVLTDETQPQPLESSGTQHFREAERIIMKDWLGWIVPNTIKAGPKIFSSILSAFAATEAT